MPAKVWSSAAWFGGADEASDQPAMAVLVTRSHDEPGSDLTTHRIDSRALVTVLDDLEAADGPASDCTVPQARGG